ncbi:c-type cytochrome [Roseateles sp. LKC17W]|uniref:C-type cytochrome n=1 Tax=Pelomonas margarita TaxID=3299031 RepID=A0ABW7FJM0_9BURK
MQRKSGRLLLASGLLAALVGAAPAWAQAEADAASVARGKRLFMRCAACHEAVAGSKLVKTGPNLHGLFGRSAGALPGYQFSTDLKAAGFVWDEAKLDAWLVKPTALAPNTTMAFVGMTDAAERKALVAFLRSLK